MKSFYTGVYFIALSACGYGVMPIFALFAYRSGINIHTLLFLRFFITALLLFAYLCRTEKGMRVTKRDLGALFVMGGILYTLQSTLYFTSLKYIPPSLTALLLYTYPIIVPLLSFGFGKERLTVRHLAAVFLSFAGLILILGGPAGKINLLGVGMAFGAALVYSCYIVLGNRLIQKIPPATASAFIALFASCSFLAASVGAHSLRLDLGLAAWWPVLGIVLFSTVLAMLMFFRGMERTGPTTASIISTLEPLVTILFSWLFFQDKLTPWQLMGTIGVLAGAVIVVLAGKGPAARLDVEVDSHS